MHGYELRQRLKEGLGELWRIASSQLYNVLHQMESRDWIKPSLETASARPARTVYRVTPAGRRAFEAWVGQPVNHLRDMRVEFLAKVYFLRHRSSAAVSDLVEEQVEVLKRLEVSLERRRGIESDDETFGEIAVSFRRKRVRSMIEWLEESRQQLVEIGEGK